MTMTPKSIILTGDEVRAFLNTKPNTWPSEPIDPTKPWKWQMRKIVKQQPDHLCPVKPYQRPNGEWAWVLAHNGMGSGRTDDGFKSPLGPVGRRVWGKETWATVNIGEGMGYDAGEAVIYRADDDYDVKWHASIHMPSHASRLELEVKTIRVERVQDISEEDAIAEGINLRLMGNVDGQKRLLIPNETFGRLWTSRHGPDAWNKNEWVFVYEFMRVR